MKLLPESCKNKSTYPYGVLAIQRTSERRQENYSPNPYKWEKTTVAKILAQQEYCGDVINFKTYSKSFKNKARIPNSKKTERCLRMFTSLSLTVKPLKRYKS